MSILKTRFYRFTLLAASVFSGVAHACVEFNGEARQGALLWARLPALFSRAYLDDESLDISAGGIVVLGFGRDERGSRTFTAEGGNFSCRKVLLVRAREYNISRVEGVPRRTVTPDPVHLERIRRERQLVAAARANSSARTDFAGGFQWPLTGRISGVYGSQRIYNGKPGNPHYGVDVARPVGTPVAAPAAGVVSLAEPDLFYSGGTVIIDHGSRVSSSFLHLAEVSVTVGQRLEPGAIIGRVGATGRATGPHLDWRMNWRNRRVDPALLVPPMP